MMKKLVITKNKKPIVKNLTKKEQDFRKSEEAVFVKQQEIDKIISKRNIERGSIASQLEFIVENGIEAFIQRDLKIRARHPKPKD